MAAGALIGQGADAGIGENHFDDVGSPQDVRDGDGHEIEISGQGVTQAVAEQDLPLRQSFRLGQQHIVRPHLL